MGTISNSSDSDNEDEEWILQLQGHRMVIVKTVDYIKLAPALQSALIFDREDHEMIKNPFVNPTTVAKANAMVDYLLRKGRENYEKFLNVLGSFYPKLFTKITNRDPPPAQEYIGVDEFSGEVLSFIFAKLSEKKQQCVNLMKQSESLRHELKNRLIKEETMKEKMKDLEARQERYDRLENDMKELKEVEEKMKSENYTICMRLLSTNEENSKLREQNMLLRQENDKFEADRRKLENKIHSERSQSVRLRRQLDTVPTERVVNAMQKEIEQLKIKVAQSHDKADIPQKDVDTRIEILQQDLHDTIELYEEASHNLNKVREELDQAEALKVKYIEENERLQLQCSALTDDCQMYKCRRDAVWEQLQEVEKERDQLMKERNEAQLTAQMYMDEKTKNWYKIQKLQEIQHKLAHELREKEQVIKELKVEARNSKDTTSLDLIQQLPSDVDQLSLSDSVASCESLSRSSRRDGMNGRSPVRRRAFKSVKTPEPENRERSLTKVIRDDIFHKLVESDGRMYDVNMSGKSILNMVELTGGNETGIFIDNVEKGSYADVIGLASGMKLLKIVMNEKGVRELHLRNCTLENVINIFREVGDSVTISVQYKEEEFRQIQERTKEKKFSGDFFYVRANFTLRKEGYLLFEKGAVLHVVHTMPDKSKDWLARFVDPYTGDDINKPGLIPSYRNCISNSQLLKCYQPMNRPLSYVDLTRIFRTMPGSQEFCNSLTAEDLSSSTKCTPYTVVKKAEVGKLQHRPCFFLPRSLCTVLSYKLTTVSEPYQFDLPIPVSVKCTSDEAYRRVISSEALSYNAVNTEMHQFVTVDAVRKIINKKKHCILPYNENCLSVENFVSMLHVANIHPIIFHLSGEKERAVKLLLQPEEKDISSILQDIKRDRTMLDKALPQYVTINLDRCSRLEDAVQQVMEHVSEETNKIIWTSGKSDVQI